MRIITIDMNSARNTVLDSALIRQGENLASELQITLSNEFLGYSYYLLLRVDNNAPIISPYLIPNERSVIRYALTSAVTATAGRLKIEIHAVNGDGALVKFASFSGEVTPSEDNTLIKSAIYSMEIKPSLDGTSAEVMPTDYVPWYNQVIQAVDSANALFGQFSEAEAIRQAGYNAFESDITALETGKADKTYTDTELAKKADKADTYTKTEVDGKDALKADKTYTDTELAKKADKATTYTKTETDTALATKARKLMATNLITNGDFSQGTTGWGSSFAVLSATANTLTITGNGTTVSPRGSKNIGIIPVLDNYYYLTLRVKVTNPNATLLTTYLRDGTTGPVINYKAITSPIQGNEYVISFVTKATSATQNLHILVDATYSDTTTANGSSHEVKYAKLINLTTTFGAGNEPTKEQMDRLLAEFPNSWFDGTQEILPLKTVNELLNEKVQVGNRVVLGEEEFELVKILAYNGVTLDVGDGFVITGAGVQKYDYDGNLIWTNPLSGYVVKNHLADFDSSGNIYIPTSTGIVVVNTLGVYQKTLETGLSTSTIAIDRVNGYLYYGVETTLRKTDMIGTLIWGDTARDDYPRCIHLLPSGRFVVGRYSTTSAVVCYNADGTVYWVSNNPYRVCAIESDENSNVYVSTSNAALAKLKNTTGAIIWTNEYITGHNQITQISKDKNGNLYASRFSTNADSFFYKVSMASGNVIVAGTFGTRHVATKWISNNLIVVGRGISSGGAYIQAIYRLKRKILGVY